MANSNTTEAITKLATPICGKPSIETRLRVGASSRPTESTTHLSRGWSGSGRKRFGNSAITLQFGLDRDINGAARDVQAAINAARADLPSSLRSNPTYRKVNPADAPVLILALTSDTLPRGDLYDAATTVLSQKLSQVDGIGEVLVGGGALPAVRVEINPNALSMGTMGCSSSGNKLACTRVTNSPNRRGRI